MPKLNKYFLFCCFFYVTFANNNTMYPSFQTQLLHDLFSLTKYDSAALPVRNISDIINMTVQIYFMDIVSLDLKNEILTTNALLSQSWRDQLLTWDPDEYGGIESLHIPIDRIWSPDLQLLKDAGQRKDDVVKLNAEVFYVGQVVYAPIVQLQSQCPVDVTYFPFDHHMCPFQFYTKLFSHTIHLALDEESELYSVLHMVTLFRPGEFNIYNAHINSSCNSSVQGDTIAATEPDGSEISYCFIEAQLFLARRPTHYIYVIVYPVIIVSLLSLLVFRLTPGSGERTTLCITLVLVYQLLLMAVGEKMPQSAGSVPLLAIYLSFELLMASLSLTMSIIVINLHAKESERQVPQWMRWLFLDKLAILFCSKKTNRFARKKQLKNMKSEKHVDDMEKEQFSKPEKDQQEQEEDEIAEEWRAISTVCDKLFFWLFVIVIFVVGLYMVIAVVIHYEGQPKEIVAQLIEEGALSKDAY